MLGEELTRKAAVALLNYESSAKSGKAASTLIDDKAKSIFAVIQLVKPIAKEVVKPVRVQIPNSLFTPEEEDTICLFCRSEDKEHLEKLRADKSIMGLTKVLSIDDVKKYYKQFKDRKELLKEHTHFVCDARVVRQLYNLLGNVFSARNNYPVPVDIDAENISKVEAALNKVTSSSYMHISGQNISIRLGTTAMSAKNVSANLINGINFAVDKLKGKWDNVHSVHIKTANSAALPVYSKLQDEMLQFVTNQAGVTDTKKKTSATVAVKKTAAIPAASSTHTRTASAVIVAAPKEMVVASVGTKRKNVKETTAKVEMEEEEEVSIATTNAPAKGAKRSKTAIPVSPPTANKSAAKKTSTRAKK